MCVRVPCAGVIQFYMMGSTCAVNRLCAYSSLSQLPGTCAVAYCAPKQLLLESVCHAGAIRHDSNHVWEHLLLPACCYLFFPCERLFLHCEPLIVQTICPLSFAAIIHCLVQTTVPAGTSMFTVKGEKKCKYNRKHATEA